MKKNYLFRLALLLFAVTLGQNVWAETKPWQQQDFVLTDYLQEMLGLDDDETSYTIKSAEDWNLLAEIVEAGFDCQGLSFKMTRDIPSIEDDVTAITKTMGCQTTSNANSRKRFKGTFDGGIYDEGGNLTGVYTINVNLRSTNLPNNPNYCAPFAYTQDATIKNLKVTGHIYTEGTFAGGLVGSTGASGKGKVTIDNVEVAVEMNCNYLSGDQGSGKYANQAGFVGIAEGGATITNSWFSGKLTGADFAYSGGFIALNKGASTLNNCFFVPTEVIAANKYGSSEFVHTTSSTPNYTLTNCYYTVSFSDPELAQGIKVVTTCEYDSQAPDYSSNVTEVKGPDGNTYYIIKHYSTWVAVVNALAGNEEVINIGADLTAGTEDVSFDVNRDVQINLNGHTIDRALAATEGKAGGYVFNIASGKTVTITNGTITGGRNTGNNGNNGNGGGIYNAGTLTLNKVTVTGNYATQGAGIYNAGTLKVTGNVQVNGNKKNGTNNPAINNVYLATGKVITVEGSIAGSSIGVTTQANANNTVVAEKGTTEGSSFEVTNFTSDVTTFHIALNDAGKAILSNAGAEPVSLVNSGTNSTTIQSNNGVYADVTLADRTIYMDGAWNSLCLPFDVTVKQLKTALGNNNINIDYLSGASFEGGTFTIDFAPLIADNASIEAGTPFFVKGTGSDKSGIVFSGVTIKNQLKDVKFNNVTLKGTYDNKVFEGENPNVRFLGAGNKLYYPGTNGYTVRALRAYFEFGSTQGIKTFVLNFGDDDDATSIEIVNEVESTNGAIYNLAGQRISKMQKGINIVNGKKILF